MITTAFELTTHGPTTTCRINISANIEPLWMVDIEIVGTPDGLSMFINSERHATLPFSCADPDQITDVTAELGHAFCAVYQHRAMFGGEPGDTLQEIFAKASENVTRWSEVFGRGVIVESTKPN